MSNQIELLTVDEAAERLLITKRRLQEICREGQIAFVQISGRVRGFTEENILEYVQRKTQQPKTVDIKGGRRVASPKRIVHKKGGEKPKSPGDKKSVSLTTKEIKQLWQS